MAWTGLDNAINLTYFDLQNNTVSPEQVFWPREQVTNNKKIVANGALWGPSLTSDGRYTLMLAWTNSELYVNINTGDYNTI